MIPSFGSLQVIHITGLYCSWILIYEIPLEGKCSQGARSLLDQIKQETGLMCSSGVVSNQSSDLWGHGYKIMTYGFSSFNDLYAESVCPNVQGGSDYILVSIIVSLQSKLAILEIYSNFS